MIRMLVILVFLASPALGQSGACSVLPEALSLAGTDSLLIETPTPETKCITGSNLFGSIGSVLGFTTGSVIFMGASDLAQDNANLFWDDASDELGIGIAAPDGMLHVHEASAGTVTAHTNADSLVVENTSAGMSLLSADAGTGRVYFGSPSDNVYAEIFAGYNGGILGIATAQAGGEIAFYADNLSETMRIEDGQVGIGTSDPEHELHVYDATDPLVMIDAGNTGPADLMLRTTTNYFRLRNTVGLFQLMDDADAVFTIETGAPATTLYVDSAGDIGMGTASPEGSLHVHTASAGTVTAWSNTDDLVIENSGAGGLTILTPDIALGAVSFGTPSDSYGGFIEYSHTAKTITLGTNIASGVVKFQVASSTDTMFLQSDGDVKIGPDTTTDANAQLHVEAASGEGICIESPNGTCCDYGMYSTAPSVGAECDSYWDSDINMKCFHDGTDWVQADDWTTKCG